MKKKYLKKIIPSVFIDTYRLHGKALFYLKRIEALKYKDDYFLLVGTPVHENIGDHLITCAELLFLHEISCKEIIEIPIEAFKLYKKKIEKIVSKKIVILIQGGGWMGTIWPDDELLIQSIISTFKENKIVIFPQTAYYEKNDNYLKIIESGRLVYRNKRLHIFLRELISYDTMSSIYPLSNTYLQPDMALYLKNKVTLEQKKQDNGIGVCFRKDKENLNSKLKASIVDYLDKSDLNYKYFDTLYYKNIDEIERERVIYNKIKEVSQFKFVITDRLHGMIISYISGVPCIAIDNLTHKVWSVYRSWLLNTETIKLIDNINDFTKTVDYFLNSNNLQDSVKYDFRELEGAIING